MTLSRSPTLVGEIDVCLNGQPTVAVRIALAAAWRFDRSVNSPPPSFSVRWHAEHSDPITMRLGDLDRPDRRRKPGTPSSVR